MNIIFRKVGFDMDEKSTTVLTKDITTTSELKIILEKNGKYMNAPSDIAEYLNEIIKKKGLKKSKIIQDSGLNKQYFYEILSGKKGKSFKQNTVLAIAIAMKMTLDETQRLLRLCKTGELYSKKKRDAIIMWGISHQKSLSDIHELLENEHEETIMKPVD